VIAVPNDMLFNTLAADTPVSEAFTMTDGILARVVLGLGRLGFSRGILPADFSRLRNLLHRRSATCSLAVGHGCGENRWQTAVEQFMECPLLGGDSALQQADFALLTIVGDASLAIGEVRAAMTALQERFADSATLITGAYVSPDVDGIELTGIAGRYLDRGPERRQARGGEATARPPGTFPFAEPQDHRESPKRSRPVQAELPLQEQSLGIFAHVAGTAVRGENLDIPTFQRRGVHLDLAEANDPKHSKQPPEKAGGET
ncbi:MAG: hypothetical protein ACOC0L_01185, partial [bacterium]